MGVIACDTGTVGAARLSHFVRFTPRVSQAMTPMLPWERLKLTRPIELPLFKTNESFALKPALISCECVFLNEMPSIRN